MPAVNEWINVYRFSTGRRSYAIGQVRAVAEALGDEAIARRADEAFAHEESTLEKERLWKIAKTQKASGRGHAVALDNQLDRLISGLFASVIALESAVDPGSELGGRCRTFVDTYFPEGPGAITKLEFEEQLGAMREILRHLEAMPAAQAAEMHVTPFSEQLARLVPEFEAELAQPTETMRFDILRKARAVGHDNLCTLIAAILAGYPGQAPEQVERRHRLLGPIVEQNERVRARMARRPAPDVEVDPTSGRELVDPVDERDPPVADDPTEPGEPSEPTS